MVALLKEELVDDDSKKEYCEMSLPKNGATPDVASFAEETLADIAAGVIPAIVDDSKMQQQCLPFMRWNLAQVKVAKETKSVPFIAECMAKLSDFKGTTLKPDRSGTCDMCLKEVTKAARCCK